MDGKPRHSSRLRQPPSQPPSAMRISTEHMAEHADPATDKQPPSPPPRLPGMEDIPDAGEVTEAAVWEWGGGLLDFTIDDDAPLILPWGPPEDRRMPSPPLPPPTDPAPLPPPQQQSSAAPSVGAAGGSSHVRKRDPRLVCENYLAGRVPCSCPEMDELELEDEVAEAVAGVRKRARVGGVSVGVARCQVPECGADISELKGYHRRHRICLRCANASSVILDGEHKRYCQQCGKFHILPDFDEGKRSCRRKLERHNKRRRRRPANDRNMVEEEKEPEGGLLPDNTCSGEPMKELSNEFASKTVNTVVSNKLMDRQMLLESEDGHGSSPICSLPSFENVQSNNAVSFAASGIDQVDERTDNTKSALYSTFCDNKSVYSSVCPTGRISFKLYDWNPAEFPRRLRHQIFEWLASMPVELEGYIRPGCTILTLFIAMPHFMWGKLDEDVTLYIKDLVNAPGSLFLGRTNFVIYVNSWIVQILKDGTLQMSAKMAGKAPRLHFVYPTYFEAGKPIEFVACGSDLDQPRFRFLVSFSGKYMVCDSCHAISHGNVCLFNGEQGDSKHEMFRIIITQTDSEIFGPAFIEVENESGLSNFVVVLFGNKHICSELERIEEAFCGSPASIDVMSQIAVSGVSPSLCKLLASKQIAMSDLFLDIAWLLKNPQLDKKEVAMCSANIQRLTTLFKFSMQNGFVCVLEVIWFYLVNMTDWAGLEMPVNMTSDTDLELLLNHLSNASEILNQRSLYDVRPELESRDSVHRLLMSQSYVKSGIIYTVPCKNQDVETRCRDFLKEKNIPLVTTVVARRKHCSPHLGARRSPGSRSNISTPNFVVVVTVGVMCLGVCVVLLPRKAGEFAVSIRRCLFGGPWT